MDVKNYFDKFVSNTVAGTSNQSYFDCPEEKTAWAFYRVLKCGRLPYSFFYTNTVDSTYSDGSASKRNDLCGEWHIHDMSVCSVKNIYEVFVDEADDKRVTLTIDGKEKKTVLPGEEFCTDVVMLDINEGGYVCVKMTFSGERVPCHIENMIPTFSYSESNREIRSDNYIPLPSMVGVRRENAGRIAFIGDSITQGIGCPEDSYANYAAVCAKELGNSYSFWNLGIGFGRGADFASDGAWAKKARNCDTAIVCFGVNDILHVADTKKAIEAFDKIVKILSGKKIIFQTVPPFNYGDEADKMWRELNKHIDTEISGRVFAVFDNTQYLSDSMKPSHALYGGHPNAVGAGIWGRHLADFLKDKI